MVRNNKGSLIKAWAKQCEYLDPIAAEVAAINWALELALQEKYVNIIVESDAKFCIDALACPLYESCWKIRHLTAFSLDLALRFNSCIFNWAMRDANLVAHTLAKAAFSYSLPCFCSKDNLPPSVKEAWIRDLILLNS